MSSTVQDAIHNAQQGLQDTKAVLDQEVARLNEMHADLAGQLTAVENERAHVGQELARVEQALASFAPAEAEAPVEAQVSTNGAAHTNGNGSAPQLGAAAYNLAVLLRDSGQMTGTQLREQLGIDSPALTHLTQEIEAAGWAEGERVGRGKVWHWTGPETIQAPAS